MTNEKPYLTAFQQYLESLILVEYEIKVAGPNPPSHVIVWLGGHVKN